MPKKIVYFSFLLLLIDTTLILSQHSEILKVDGDQISIEFNDQLYSRVLSKINDQTIILSDFRPSEFVEVDGKIIKDFILDSYSNSLIEDEVGKGKQYKIIASSKLLKKIVLITSYNEFPTMLFMRVMYENVSRSDINVDSWTNNNYAIKAMHMVGDTMAFWSYLPGSYGWAHNWIQPIKKGFVLENYMGMNHIDYGGGTPVVDVWRRDVGLAVGHVELVPKLVSLPVSMQTDNEASIAVTYKSSKILHPKETLSTFKTFVSVHQGDHFQTLSEYNRFMVDQGIEFKEAPETAYETIWCSWGYEKGFTLKQIYETFPKVKELGIDWVVLDYGWDTGVGDELLNKDIFPNGDAGMKVFVDSVHTLGAKAKLWWMPISVEPGTDLYKESPQNVLLDKNNNPVNIEFFKSYFMCPAYEEVIKRTRNFVIRALKDWGYDGFKIDGNHLNSVPPCYNTEHHHAYPEESVEALPGFFKMIYETALSIKADAVIEICPCGTNYSFYNLPYMNQTVASDPQSSWQIRLKGKTIKALSGSKVAYYGDHVELSDGKSDFASTVGIGGVVGTKFIWPEAAHMNVETGNIGLTPQKEKEWKKWIGIYNDKMLPKGNYLGGLYDIGYDRPEAHVIQKGDTLYYAFYAKEFDGNLELRGLDNNKNYKLKDYVNDIDMGVISSSENKVKASFEQFKLIEAIEINN
ncbi:MAG: glycoside hydrolase family 36 protein [Ignavibacteriaceae bacterium]